MARKKSRGRKAGRIDIDLEWLNRERDNPLHDLQILRSLFRKHFYGGGKLPKLEYRRFELDQELKIISEEDLTEDQIRERFDYDDVSRDLLGREKPLKPEGKRLWDKMESLTRLEQDHEFREQILFVLSRVALGDLEPENAIAFAAKSLDPITAALLNIHLIAMVTGQTVGWLRVIWERRMRREKTEIPGSVLAGETFPEHGRTTLIVDGFPVYRYESFISELRSSINILQNSQVREMLKYLRDVRTPGHPVGNDAEKAIGGLGRDKYGVAKTLRQMIMEFYWPTLAGVGLRFRHILTQRIRPMIDSDGLAENLVVSPQDWPASDQSVSMGERARLTMHIEPVESKGPEEGQIVGNPLMITTDRNVISFRGDLYDVQKKEWRSPWISDREQVVEDGLSVSRSSRITGKKTYHPTQRETNLMGVLWATPGTSAQRSWVLRSLEFPRATQRKAFERLTEKGILSIQYLPVLEYCALPEELIIVVKGAEKSKLSSYIEWVSDSFPFSVCHYSETGSLLARMLIPQATSRGITQQILSERLRNLGGVHALTTLRWRRSYQFTVLNRLYRKDRWSDPWTS